MEATSEAGWQYRWSPHLNKPRRHLHRPTSNGPFEKLRAGELRGSSERDYRTFCTNRPLRCCCRPLFSLEGWKGRNRAEEEEERRVENAARSARKRWDESVFIQVSLILEGGRETHLRETGEASIAGLEMLQGTHWAWASVSLQSAAARTRPAWQGFKTGSEIWARIAYRVFNDDILQKTLPSFLEDLKQSPAYPLSLAAEKTPNKFINDGQTFLESLAFFFFLFLSLLCLKGNKYPEAI